VNVFEDEIEEEFAGGMYPQSEDEGVTSMGETTDCDTDWGEEDEDNNNSSLSPALSSKGKKVVGSSGCKWNGKAPPRKRNKREK